MSMPAVIYSVSILPTLFILVLYFKKVLPLWVMKVYLLSFLICVFGWEMWYTYGWVDGDHVNLRRSDDLNRILPVQINWVLNSLYDAALCLSGLFWVWLAGGKTLRLFDRMNIWVFLILFLVFVGQNVFVELVIYKDQLTTDHNLSWAPLSPKWLDTITVFGATLKFNVQMTWVFMVPIFFFLVRYFKPKNK
jgi:hypothetical protein